MKTLWQQFNSIQEFFIRLIPTRKKYICTSFFASLSELFFNLVLAYMLKGVYTAIDVKSIPLLLKTIYFFIMLLAGSFAYNYIFWCLHSSSGVQITGTIRRRVISKLCMLRLRDVENCHSSEIMSILTNDINTAQDVYLRMRLVISSVMLGFVSTVLVFKTFVLLGFAISFMAVFQLVINLCVINPLEYQSKKIREDTLRINSKLTDILQNNMTIRLFCSRDFQMEIAKGICKDLYHSKMKLYSINALIEGINVFFGLLGYIIVLIVGSVLIGVSKLSLPNLLFITQMRLTMIQGILAIGNNALQLQSAVVGARKILSFMNYETEESM